MKFKGTFWLIAVFAGIALYYYLVDVPAEKKRIEAKDRSERILLFEPADVETFHLVKKGQTIQLKRKDADSWEMLQPVKDKADARTISSFLLSLKGARFVRPVDEDAQDLSIYGLEDPYLKIMLQLKDKTEKSLLLGGDNPINDTTYVKRGDDNKVLLFSADKKILDKSVFDLRSKMVLDFNSEDINKVKLQNEGASFELVKNGDRWDIVGDIKARAGDDEVRRLLNLVKSGKVQEFADEAPETLSEYGLEPPRIQLTLEAGKESKPLHLLVGHKRETQGYYGKIGDAQNVVVLGGGLVDILSQKPVDFLNKGLLDFKEDQVAELHLRTQEEKIELMRDKEDTSKWRITHPSPSPADAATVNSLLFDLKDAKVEEFVKSDIKDPELYGLETPQKSLTVHMKESDPWTLDLGNTSSDGGHYFARRTGDSTVFTIATDTVTKLFRSPHEIKDKHLLSFKTDEIEKVLIEYHDKYFELLKKDDRWSLERPEKIREVKGISGKDILWTLNTLEYESLADASAHAETGLDKPSLVITLWNPKNQKVGKLSVGKKVQDREEHFAQMEGNPALYTVKSRFLDEIPKDVERFKN